MCPLTSCLVLCRFLFARLDDWQAKAEVSGHCLHGMLTTTKASLYSLAQRVEELKGAVAHSPAAAAAAAATEGQQVCTHACLLQSGVLEHVYTLCPFEVTIRLCTSVHPKACVLA